MKISICIPVYNQCKYIEQAVRSAAEQTLQPFEIIVSDDCSTDNTADVLEKLKAEFENLKVLKQPQNIGIAKNTDFCLRVARGEYIVRLDSDDFLSKYYCEKLYQKLEAYPNAAYAHAAVQEVNEDGVPRKIRKLYRNSGFESNIHSLKASVKGYQVAANIILFRKDALELVNYLTDRPEYVEDYHLSVALAASGYGNIYVDKVLSNYRVWTDTGKVRLKRKLAEIIGIRRVFEEGLEPVFASKNWDQKRLVQSKEKFASNHAECLGWDIYNNNEKNELQRELYKLSCTRRVRFYSIIYRKGWGKPIQLGKIFLQILKDKIKKYLVRVNITSEI